MPYYASRTNKTGTISSWFYATPTPGAPGLSVRADDAFTLYPVRDADTGLIKTLSGTTPTPNAGGAAYEPATGAGGFVNAARRKYFFTLENFGGAGYLSVEGLDPEPFDTSEHFLTISGAAHGGELCKWIGQEGYAATADTVPAWLAVSCSTAGAGYTAQRNATGALREADVEFLAYSGQSMAVHIVQLPEGDAGTTQRSRTEWTPATPPPGAATQTNFTLVSFKPNPLYVHASGYVAFTYSYDEAWTQAEQLVVETVAADGVTVLSTTTTPTGATRTASRTVVANASQYKAGKTDPNIGAGGLALYSTGGTLVGYAPLTGSAGSGGGGGGGSGGSSGGSSVGGGNGNDPDDPDNPGGGDDPGPGGGSGDGGGGGDGESLFRVFPQTQYKPAGEAAELSVSFYGDDPVPVRVLATDCTASTDGTISVPAGAKEASAFYWNASGELAVAYVFEDSSGGEGGGDEGGDGGDSGGGDSGGGGSVTPPPEPGAFLWANPPRLVFPPAGGALRVVVASSSTWSSESGFETISFSRERDGEYTPRKLEGLPAGDAVELFVRVAEDSGAVETPLTFRNEEGEEFIVELRVEDAPSDPGEDLFPVLSLSPAYLSGADAQARAWSLNVSSNREFVIDPASVPEWLSVETADGALTEADCPLLVRAAANASLEARASRLSFSTVPTDADEAATTRWLSVAQAGAAPNALLSAAAAVAAAGGIFPLHGYARAGWAWSVAARDASAFPEWLAPAAGEAAGTGASAEFACAFVVAANTGAEPRECVLLVSFTDAESGAAEAFEFTVSQAASATPFLELNHSAGTVNPAAGELSLEISSNCAAGNISAESSDPEWLRAELSGSRLILLHSANASLRARTASVVVRESEFGLEARFTLTQLAPPLNPCSAYYRGERANGILRALAPIVAF